MKKNFWIAILIAFIGGSFGLQEFYVGNIGRGLLSVLFCWTCIPAIVAIVQVIMWLFNGEDWFNAKYN